MMVKDKNSKNYVDPYPKIKTNDINKMKTINMGKTVKKSKNGATGQPMFMSVTGRKNK